MNFTAKKWAVTLVAALVVLISISYAEWENMSLWLSGASIVCILFAASEKLSQRESWGDELILAICILIAAITVGLLAYNSPPSAHDTFFMKSELLEGFTFVLVPLAVGSAYWFGYFPEEFTLPNSESRDDYSTERSSANKDKKSGDFTKFWPFSKSETKPTSESSRGATRINRSKYRMCNLCGKKLRLSNACTGCGFEETTCSRLLSSQCKYDG